MFIYVTIFVNGVSVVGGKEWGKQDQVFHSLILYNLQTGEAICSKRCCALLDCAWNPCGIIQYRFSLFCCFSLEQFYTFCYVATSYPYYLYQFQVALFFTLVTKSERVHMHILMFVSVCASTRCIHTHTHMQVVS